MQALKLQGLFNARFLKNLLPIPATNRLERSQRVPNFLLPDVANRTTVKLSDFVGKHPVLLDFTRIFTENHYCPLCYPHLVALNEQYETFAAQGIAVLLVTSTDTRQSQRVVQDLGLKLPVLSNPSCDVFRLFQTGQALGAPLPAQFVIDLEGRLQAKHLFSFLEPNAPIAQLQMWCDQTLTRPLGPILADSIAAPTHPEGEDNQEGDAE
ncbi:peroxiredoxin family protein [Spirulina major]|uniref:peroxiredoxin family protein n=1 Tax=Spirulina major TaxID=270636 RepID=UPI000933DA50|nr:peroxiredoxin family protein [Spirulina major]